VLVLVRSVRYGGCVDGVRIGAVPWECRDAAMRCGVVVGWWACWAMATLEWEVV